MNRRGFLLGMAGILATATAPAIVRAASIMPVAAPPDMVWLASEYEWMWSDGGIFVPGEVIAPIQVILEVTMPGSTPATIQTIGTLWKRIEGLEFQPSIISVMR